MDAIKCRSANNKTLFKFTIFFWYTYGIMYFGLLSNIVINFSPWGKLANWHKNGKRKFNKIHHFLNWCVEGNNSTKELFKQKIFKNGFRKKTNNFLSVASWIIFYKTPFLSYFLITKVKSNSIDNSTQFHDVNCVIFKQIQY